MRGRFSRYDVVIVTGDDPRDSSVTATIDLASIDTGNEKRDQHIRSVTFLDVENHPTVRYHSTGIRPTGDGWLVDGDLTMHGVTRQVPLTVMVSSFGPHVSGGQWARFSATARVNRGEFGIDRWSGGGAVVSDKVPIRFEIEAVLNE